MIMMHQVRTTRKATDFRVKLMTKIVKILQENTQIFLAKATTRFKNNTISCMKNVLGEDIMNTVVGYFEDIFSSQVDALTIYWSSSLEFIPQVVTTDHNTFHAADFTESQVKAALYFR